MNDLINSLYTILQTGNDQETWSALAGNIDKQLLEQHGIIYDEYLNEVKITFTEQENIYIFKTKNDFYKYSKEGDFKKKIIVIQDKLLFEPDKNSNFIFDNVLYSFKLFNFLKLNISSHHDLAKKQLIFLSEKTGKNIIGYKRKNETDLTKDLQLKRQYENIVKYNEEFFNFLKNSIVCYVELTEPKNRYITAIKNLDTICENAKRDFDLYKSKFSFSKFTKELETEKAKYIQDIQSLVSDFSSKLYMPIEFGIYIVLITRFSENFYPLIATMIIIISWGIFRIWSNKQTLNNADYLEETIIKAFDRINKESKQDIEKSKLEIRDSINKVKNEVKAYIGISVIFSVSAICIALSLMCNLL